MTRDGQPSTVDEMDPGARLPTRLTALTPARILRSVIYISLLNLIRDLCAATSDAVGPRGLRSVSVAVAIRTALSRPRGRVHVRELRLSLDLAIAARAKYDE